LRKEDFERCQWQEVIANCSEKECISYCQHFQKKAKEAEENDDLQAQTVFSLLARITYLGFHLDTQEQPFAPAAAIEQISDDDISLLEEIMPDVADAEMRARIADIVWLRQKIRRGKYHIVRLAANSYLEAARKFEGSQTWIHCTTRIERALQLAVLLGEKNNQLYENIISYIEETLDNYDQKALDLFAARMMHLLQKYVKSEHSQYAARYAPVAEKMALRAEALGTWHIARAYWVCKAGWHRLERNTVAEQSARESLAETYVKEAQIALSASEPSYLAVCAHLRSAIEAFRAISKKQRTDELHELLLEYQEKIPGQLRRVEVEIDISEMVEKAIAAVKDKSLDDAIRALALIGKSQEITTIRRLVEDITQRTPLLHLLERTLQTNKGKVTAQKPSMAGNPLEVEEAFQDEMFEYARYFQGLHAQGLVEPARTRINLEHNVQIQDLIPLVTHNPFVPPGRELIFARGLMAGFAGDLLVAGHLLVPQLENSIRYQLYRQGIITSTLTSPEGIQDELSLNAIFDDHRTKLVEIFGSNIVFDLEGLLIHRFWQ
jgi:tetratricopeptide (TPR) repeat protein